MSVCCLQMSHLLCSRLVACSMIVLSACGKSPGAGSAPQSGLVAQTAPASEPSGDSGAKFPPGRAVSVDSELREVAAVRQLQSLAPVTGRSISDDDLMRLLENSFRENMPERVLEGTGTALRALGVVPFDFQYEATILRLLRSDLAGLYDPDYKALFLRTQLRGDALRATLLHELVHALQDQHYNLGDLTRYRDDGGDRASAVSALAEGDATSAMFDGMLAAHGKTALDLPDDLLAQQFASASALDEGGAPPLIRRSLLAPYVDGLRFVQALRRRGGFSEVDRVWKNLPTSTEQILHLEKYDAHERSLDVELPLPPPVMPGSSEQPWRAFFHDVFGEQSLRLVLEEWLPFPQAAAAAAGWGGDRIAVYEQGSGATTETATAWVIQLDAGVEPDLLFAAVSAGVQAQRTPSTSMFPLAPPSPRGPHDRRPSLPDAQLCGQRDLGGPIAAGRQGRRLAIVAGPARPDGRNSTGCAATLAWLARVLANNSPADKAVEVSR